MHQYDLDADEREQHDVAHDGGLERAVDHRIAAVGFIIFVQISLSSRICFIFKCGAKLQKCFYIRILNSH